MHNIGQSFQNCLLLLDSKRKFVQAQSIHENFNINQTFTFFATNYKAILENLDSRWRNQGKGRIIKHHNILLSVAYLLVMTYIIMCVALVAKCD